MHLRDRAIIGLLSLSLVALVGAVVAPTLNPDEPNATPATGQPDLRPYVEGVVGSAQNVGPFSARSVVEREITALLFRGLVRLGPDARMVGDLADHWAVDPTGSTWTFHLRPGVTWQDGAPLTSADVVFTIQTLSDPAYTGPGASSWREVSAAAPDPETVVLTLATPLGGFLQAATQPIAPQHLLRDIDPAELPGDPFGQQPIGSGAFRLATLDATHALLVQYIPAATDGSTGPSPTAALVPTDSLASPTPSAPGAVLYPYLDGIEIRFFSDIDALKAAWGLGELDGAAGLPAADAIRIASDGSARVLRYPSNTLFDVTLNLRSTHPEFRAAAVRRALLVAIDRALIVREVLGGLGSRAEGLIPDTNWAFDAEATAPALFDPTAARAALTKAGWKFETASGWIPKGSTKPLEIELLSLEAAANPVAFGIAAGVARDWTAIGLTVTHTALPASEFFGQRLQTGAFDAAVIGTSLGLDPDLYPLLASTQTVTTGLNLSGVQDATLDGLLVKARAPGSVAERKAAYSALQKRLAAETYVLPVAFGDFVVVVRNELTGPDPQPLGNPGDRFWDVLTWRLAAGR